MAVINEVHCRSCGNIVDEECGAWQGYTSCCNKPTAPPGCYNGCSHSDDDKPSYDSEMHQGGAGYNDMMFGEGGLD